MTDNVENIIIEHLKALRSEVRSLRSEMHEDFQDVKARIDRIQRIERRLELS